ncbi:hypothetical protein [Lederbergia galactosidilytica]|uniref:Uncharacterized protein n=1 Tax=Lederbergia galactosidilytica TaxID=217031 RepID=A0A178A6I1_9BACI|nr:hypothetical protein [Lederbergia galactosidilytica]KRG07992.1 hypothetical protein ACA30_22860 [Virgibacillus soli]MBP1915222.1 hypothetical protein [Lederbergia galactosidilytica]OAK75439.1 hypothetical protein ABB05_01645 [Lederbergia galactosidilytica]
MKKIPVYLFLFLLLAGCSLSNVQHNEELEDAIYLIVSDENNDKLSLNSMTTFDWDKAYLFTPYSTQESITEQLGVDFKDPSDIDWRDDIYLLVFLDSDQVIQYAELERQGADFSIGEKQYLTPTDDIINIKHD